MFYIMKKNIDFVNFDDIDLSEFNSEINKIHQEVDNIKNKKKIMKKLSKIKLDSQKKIYDITYNNNDYNNKNIDIAKFNKLTKKIIIEKKSRNDSYSSSYNPTFS